jgi:hypothetical protein
MLGKLAAGDAGTAAVRDAPPQPRPSQIASSEVKTPAIGPLPVNIFVTTATNYSEYGGNISVWFWP